ncbi:MAG: hypothetical protein MI924_29820 [Chloroflexales bacterium]|nr:hypothetical protein [Chloroflexales bacterium]
MRNQAQETATEADGSTETSASSVEPLAKVLTPAQYRVIEALLVGRTGKDAVEKAT